ncbi:MAG TPA: hypothetical protein VHW23_46675 [Kofleriaceae bacterium]|jgi:hypothetical protein|nr:hypothetical protein [Kofleriaceae bacterium]
MLHTALATAPDRPMVPAAAALAGIALVGAMLAFTARVLLVPHPGAAVTSAAPGALPSAAVAPVAILQPPAAGAELTLVFRAAGASYLSLVDLADDDDHADAIPTPLHGPPHVAHGGGIVAAVAPVDDDDVPAVYLGWQGRRVVVDDVCPTTVVGFAVVSRQISGRGPRIAGDPLRSGHAVLAARLDGCTGSYARDAAPATW